MEDGPNGPVQLSDYPKNGVVDSIMANFPEGTVAATKEDKVNSENTKVNGDNTTESHDVFDEDSYHSESDALVIDESIPKQKKSRKKSSKNVKTVPQENKVSSSLQNNIETHNNIDVTNEKEHKSDIQNNHQVNCEKDLEKDKSDTEELELPLETNEVIKESQINNSELTHSNPYFNESLFELSQQHHTKEDIKKTSKETLKEDNGKQVKPKRVKSKPKPKLKEYAQYLGLQPTVQFKCSKCSKSGFESLNTLQEHLIQCNSVQNVQEEISENENSFNGFKLTRKVFLCSACGTYYENWNLYMHMLEFHRRYICLYCLGMFSILEDLCQHIQSRHNLEPGHKNSLDEFFNVYNEPCYIVCCECNKLFNEQDNFFYHNCVGVKTNLKAKKQIKQQILPENHVTGETVDKIESNKVSKDKSDIQENIVVSEKEKSDSLNDIDNAKNVNKNIEVNFEKGDTTDNKTSDDIKNLSSEEQKSDLNLETIESNETAVENNEKEGSSDDLDENSLPNHNETGSDKDCDKSIDTLLNSTEELDEEPHLEDSTNTEEDHLEIKQTEMESEPIETRKVPKLSLKLPKPGSYPTELEDSDDSEKLTMEVDQVESENETIDVQEEKSSEPQMQIAGADVPIIELELEQPLDKIDISILLQKCLKSTALSCIYCNHARKIAVNGKQLALHAIAEHRYSAIVKSITAEELIPESFVSRIKESLEELDTVFFNLDSGPQDEAVTFSHLFECFQCHYSTTVHKELYLHNRKFHSKNLLLCIMCKSNFYSYSELICHLCPGVYVLDYDLKFRCCMCVSDDLPSAFRLMVHLRKRHNVCDVCLEMCHNQYRLSNHVWKHKLHHFCYRCGIAYRNKPDITRHLFWKHGTESVMCKKCLQKKWPHVYHFCVPPATFTCEECSLIFTRAVSLKVHKRLHTEEKKHPCTFECCTEKFISKKLMLKHELRHREPPPEEKKVEEVTEEEKKETTENETETKEEYPEEKLEETPKPPKPKIDVYDLPELNLSESDSSDSETETLHVPRETSDKIQEEDEKPHDIPLNETDTVSTEPTQIETPLETPVEDENPTNVMQDIWNNFQNYQANKEKLDQMFEPEKTEQVPDIPIPQIEEELTVEIALRDHDYCIDPEKKTDITLIEVKPALTLTERVDHDYCFQKPHGVLPEKPPIEEKKDTKEEEKKSPKKRTNSTSSDSSSSSSSSCSCGSNCSCSSSSGSSSSSSESSDSDSSTEEGRKKQQARRQRRKQKNTDKEQKSESKTEVDVVATDQIPVIAEMPIQESDLETTESETDEEFYDKQPQKLAKKILDEKRAQLLAEMGPNSIPNGSFIESTSRPPTPPAGTGEEETKPKKKKTKKRKKRKSDKKELQETRIREYTSSIIPENIPIPPYYQQFHQQPPTVAPITLSISRNSPTPTISATVAKVIPAEYPKVHTEPAFLRQDPNDLSLRASKRRRVPNKFYGYSSDEEEGKTSAHPPVAKWRKTEVSPAPRSPLTVPPITIKTVPSPASHPTVEPISIRVPTAANPGADFSVHQRTPIVPPIRLFHPRLPPTPVEADSATDSDASEGEQVPAGPPVFAPPKANQPQLYCYCRCPYDEVSEMIGCDASDCAIEWFHFECVGIMVPPKGQWFCPDCRKKKQQQRREALQT